MSHLHRQLGRFTWDCENERCAVVLGGSHVSLWELNNIHPAPRTNFRISRTAVDELVTRLRRPVIGILHTHPDPDWRAPSPADLCAAASRPEYRHGMYHPATRRLVWYDGAGITSVEHVRPRLRTNRH